MNLVGHKKARRLLCLFVAFCGNSTRQPIVKTLPNLPKSATSADFLRMVNGVEWHLAALIVRHSVPVVTPAPRDRCSKTQQCETVPLHRGNLSVENDRALGIFGNS
jgi:hypothetical protein